MRKESDESDATGEGRETMNTIFSRRALYTAGLLSALLLTVGSTATAQKPKTKPPVKPKTAVGTIGTKQMEGTEGQIGVTYSLKTNEALDAPFNITITRVTYSTQSFRYNDWVMTPPREQKYLVVHYLCQNPTKEDIEIPSYYQANKLFQAVGSDNKTYTPDESYKDSYLDNPNLAPAKNYAVADLKLKPGQKSETVFALIPIPADVTVPKLIVKRGRVGTKEQVVRFDLRDKVKSDFGRYANAANPAVPLEECPAVFGTAYPLSSLEVTVSDVKREPGPFENGGFTADEGKEFITGTVALKNVAPQERYLWVDYCPVITLVDADGEKTTFDRNQGFLRVNRTSRIEVGNVEPLDSRKGVFFFQVPKGTKIKQIIVSEVNFPDTQYRRLVYDVSNL
jgi:hypothetical protein